MLAAGIDYIGVATVIAAIGSATAAIIGAMNRGTAKDASRTVHRVETSTDQLHEKVDAKLSEHDAIVKTLQVIADESASRAKVSEDYIAYRKAHDDAHSRP